MRQSSVYPRVCGGTWWEGSTASAVCGLSPRVRGNHPHGSRRAVRPGSIPACAGEPMAANVDGSCKRVYPRVCGGTPKDRLRRITTCGLSPRVRGNPASSHRAITAMGSIPACAGEPSTLRATPCAEPVYPRVCGGTLSRAGPLARRTGLSPRVRGNRLRTRKAKACWRSIPACAGTRLFPADKDAAGGSIPACAGEPSLRVIPKYSLWVYPRVCGGTMVPRWCEYH